MLRRGDVGLIRLFGDPIKKGTAPPANQSTMMYGKQTLGKPNVNVTHKSAEATVS